MQHSHSANRQSYLKGICFGIYQQHRIPIMQTERHISLFRNGRNQAIRIPREFELEGKEATIRKEGDKLIIEPIRKKGLSQVLATLKPLDENLQDFADDLDEKLIPLDTVDL